MPYDIELMSIGDDLYGVLERSAALLNGVEQEFRFRLTSPNQRSPGLGFRFEEYTTAQVWDFLREQRTTFGGNRPYIIAFIT